MITSPIRPMACESDDIMLIAPRSWRTSSAAMVSARMRDSAKARSSGIDGTQMMADHEHVQMLIQGVHGEGHRRIGRRRQAVRFAANRDNVRSMAATGAFGMIGVDGSAFKGADRILHKASFVKRIGVNRHLYVVLLGHTQGTVNRRGSGSPILMKLETDRARLDLLAQEAQERMHCLFQETPRLTGNPSAA